MARIYAEEVSRRGAKVKLEFQGRADAEKQAQDAGTSASTPSEPQPTGSSAQSEETSQTTSSTVDQEVIVLRGGFTRW